MLYCLCSAQAQLKDIVRHTSYLAEHRTESDMHFLVLLNSLCRPVYHHKSHFSSLGRKPKSLAPHWQPTILVWNHSQLHYHYGSTVFTCTKASFINTCLKCIAHLLKFEVFRYLSGGHRQLLSLHWTFPEIFFICISLQQVFFALSPLGRLVNMVFLVFFFTFII